MNVKTQAICQTMVLGGIPPRAPSVALLDTETEEFVATNDRFTAEIAKTAEYS